MSHQCQSRSQMHLQSGCKRYYCCCNHPGWPHFHCRTTLYPTAHLNPGQRQHPVLPVWHIHTPAADRPPLLLQCPRSRHRQSATHHFGTLLHGLDTGCCCPRDEYWSSLGLEQSRELNYILKFNFRSTVAAITLYIQHNTMHGLNSISNRSVHISTGTTPPSTPYSIHYMTTTIAFNTYSVGLNVSVDIRRCTTSMS